jgi:signal transduction histidine kinase
MQEIISGRHNISGPNQKRNSGVLIWPKSGVKENGHNEKSSSDVFRKVEQAKQEWEAALDSLPELICVIDHQGNVVRANRTVEQWNLGPVVSVRGRSFHDLLHPNCSSEDCFLDLFVADVMQLGGANQSIQLEILDAFLGRHVLIKAHPVDSGKEIAYQRWAVEVRDVTQRKLMEDALRDYTNRLEAMNSIGEAILSADSPQEIAEAALSRMRRLMTFQRALLALSVEDEILVLDVYAERRSNRIQETLMPVKTFTLNQRRGLDKFLMVEDLAILPKPSWLEEQLLGEGMLSYLSIPLLANNSFIGAFILGADQTGGFGQKEIEIANEVGDLLAIATQHSRLRQKLGRANTSLQQALLAREEMIQNVSHELRTPLQIMRGYTTLMNEELFGELSDDQNEAVEIISGRIDQLEFLVTRLLTLQTLDKEELDFAVLSLEPILRSIIDSWQLRAKNQKIDLEYEAAGKIPEIISDPNLITLAIGNLVNNAIKFSPEGGKVTVRTWTEDAEIFISVSDEGIGIQPHQLEEIFERFVQADGSSTRSFGGMGIGLALSHDIVAAHGGRIWAESDGLDKGSTFYIVLPSAELSQEQSIVEERVMQLQSR